MRKNRPRKMSMSTRMEKLTQAAQRRRIFTYRELKADTGLLHGVIRLFLNKRCVSSGKSVELGKDVQCYELNACHVDSVHLGY